MPLPKAIRSGFWPRTFIAIALALPGTAQADVQDPCLKVSGNIADYHQGFAAQGWTDAPQSERRAIFATASAALVVSRLGKTVVTSRDDYDKIVGIAYDSDGRSWGDAALALTREGKVAAVFLWNRPSALTLFCVIAAPDFPEVDSALSAEIVSPDVGVTLKKARPELPGATRVYVTWARLELGQSPVTPPLGQRWITVTYDLALPP